MVSRAGRTKQASSASQPRPQSAPRYQALHKIASAYEKARNTGKLKEADLELITYDAYKTPDGTRGVSFYVDREDEDKAAAYMPFNRVILDTEKKKIYFESGAGYRGPIKMPAGVSVKALLDDRRRHAAPENDQQKAVVSLAKKVKAKLPEIYGQDRISMDYHDGAFHSPDGERLEHYYTDDPTYRLPGGAVMIGDDQFWVEMIPGVSGDCIGPFDLPRGFDATRLEAPEEVDTTSSSDAFDSSSSRPSNVIYGADSGSYRPSPGGSGSGGYSNSVSVRYWNGPGGGGS